MQNVLTLVRFLQRRRPILLEIATDICRYRSPWTRRDRPLSEWPTICPEVTPAARPATPLSPGEQSRETSVAARAAVVVGPRAHPRHFHPPRERCAGARNARTDEDSIRLLDHAGTRAHATTAESPFGCSVR